MRLVDNVEHLFAIIHAEMSVKERHNRHRSSISNDLSSDDSESEPEQLSMTRPKSRQRIIMLCESIESDDESEQESQSIDDIESTDENSFAGDSSPNKFISRQCLNRQPALLIDTDDNASNYFSESKTVPPILSRRREKYPEKQIKKSDSIEDQTYNSTSIDYPPSNNKHSTFCYRNVNLNNTTVLTGACNVTQFKRNRAQHKVSV